MVHLLSLIYNINSDFRWQLGQVSTKGLYLLFLSVVERDTYPNLFVFFYFFFNVKFEAFIRYINIWNYVFDELTLLSLLNNILFPWASLCFEIHFVVYFIPAILINANMMYIPILLIVSFYLNRFPHFKYGC